MIGFAGLSHLGIVSSAAAAAKGFAVVGYDPDAALCASLARGGLPVVEPGLAELLGRHTDRIRFSADPATLAGCSLIYVARDVPTDDQGRSTLDTLNDLVGRVTSVASPAALIVILSQVPPGFTRATAAKLEREHPERGGALYYQVETLVFGNAVERALNPERVILGCPDPGTPVPEPLRRYLEAFGCPVLAMRYESAELCKIAINMFLVSSVSTTNMLAEVCEAIGADWAEIVPALRLDRRIGQHAYLSPGLGIGGGNLLRDVATLRAMANQHGTNSGLLDAWMANSAHRQDWALHTLRREVLSKTPDPVVAVWGLAYKENTASTVRSPALAMIRALDGVAVRAYDPAVRLEVGWVARFSQCSSPLEACRGADALAIMTPWPEFRAIDARRIAEALRGSVVIDPYGMLRKDQTSAHGLRCFRLGAPTTG